MATPATPEWAASTTYTLGAYVMKNKKTFKSLKDGNTGHDPELYTTTTKDWWTLVAFLMEPLSPIPAPPNRRVDTQAEFDRKVPLSLEAQVAMVAEFNSNIIPAHNTAVMPINEVIQYLTQVDRVAQSAGAVDIVASKATDVEAVSKNITSVTTTATHIAAVITAPTYAQRAETAAGKAEAIAGAGIATPTKPGLVAPRNGLTVDALGNVDVELATPTKPGLIAPRNGLTVDALGNVDVEALVFVLGAPVVNLAKKIPIGEPSTVSLSAPSVILPGATVVSFHVSVDGGVVQDVPAVNNSAVFTFTPAGAAGTTVTLKVTATDSVGNRSLNAIETAQVVNSYVDAPTIISPSAGGHVAITGITIVTDAFAGFGTSQTHISSNFAITTETGDPNTPASVLHAFSVTTGNLLVGVAKGYTVAQGTKLKLWAQHVGSRTGSSEWSAGVVVTARGEVCPGGRVYYRHESNQGIVMECNIGQKIQVVIADSALRDKRKFGTYGTDMPQLKNYDKANTRGDWYLNTSNAANTNAATVMTDEQINSLWRDSIDEKTSKQNCSVWMTKAGTTDTQSVVGVPAVEFARSKSIGGVPCDVPNIQILMRIFLDADFIDERDPTAAANPTKALGKMNSGGFFNCMGTNYAWSSAEYTYDNVRGVSSSGHCDASSKGGECFVVPVREL